MNKERHTTHHDAVESGAVEQSFEGVSTQFTQLLQVAARKNTTLWKAKRYGRWFMLKALKAEFATDVAHQQLLVKEFNSLMAIQHPCVVNCYGMEQVQGAGMCIVMEYVEGETLQRWLEAEHSADEEGRIVNKLLEAVAGIHQAGMVHRDLKHENVMITRIGNNVKIIDFGLADTDDYALFKQPAGTKGYVSKEQSQSSVPDVRNDIYSLGAIMEQMPHTAHRYHKVVKRCLTDIDNRYESVEQVQTAIHATAMRRKAWRNTAIVLPVLAAIVATLILIWPKQSSGIPSIILNPSMPTDTTVTNTTDATDATNSVPSAAPESPSATTPPATMPANNRAETIEKAKIEGEKILRAKFPSREFAHLLDTISSRNYMTQNDWNKFQDGHHIVNKYIEDIKGHFSSTELTDIYNHLCIVNGNIIKELYDKYNQKVGE